ncbi:MAG: PBP1A family penicillin-binding protein [Patescibacteria group bacterium]|nr:PBP1A family penicillin-binding protein [Patescibacteria group bacterium]
MPFINNVSKLIKNIGFIIIFPFEKILVITPKIYKAVKKEISTSVKALKNKKIKGKKSKKIKKKTKIVPRKKVDRFKNIRKIIPSIKKKWKVFLGNLKTRLSKILNLKPYFVGALISVVFIFTPLEIYRWFRELPTPGSLVTKANQSSTRILDRNGKLLYEIYVDKKYNPISLDEVPLHVIQSTIAVEDDKFYSHWGIRLDSVIRAAKNNFFGGNLQGGSTITQQLIKNVLLSPERTVSRKIKEAVLALLVEVKYSKSQILEMYLNNVPYGGTSWGIQSAAQKYFGKNVWELNIAESTLLAGLPSSPTSYSPITDLEKAKERQRYVLDRMVETRYISKEEVDEAFDMELNFIDQVEFIRAPHFVIYVRGLLEKEYGKRFVELGDLTITTTLDLELHDKVQEIVKEEVGKNSYLGFSNGAAVVLDSKNSEILAYVGSVDYFQEGWGAFDVVTGYRQPGSSIKPVTYALALSRNYTPATIIDDSAITYKVEGQKPYTPVNYDGKFHGKVTVRQALANSYNVPAVKVASSVGPDNIVDLGHKMGLSNWKIDGSYGLSVTLGGKEVRLLDHTNVFGTLSRNGIYKETTPILSVKDSKGYEIYKDRREDSQVLSSEVSYLIWHILSDNVARTPAFGSGSSLVIPGYKVAVKTGTTDNIKDNWTLGYTPSYVVGVWVGNNDGTPMNRYLASGLTGAAPIWNKIMTEVLDGKPNEVYEKLGDIFVKYDEKCGVSEVFIKGTFVPETLCIEKEEDEDGGKDDDD